MNTQRIEKILKGAAWPAIILAAIVATASIAYAAYAVGHLFSVYIKIEAWAAALAVVSSVGMAVGLLLIVVTSDNQNARGLGAILLLAWVLLTLTMVALDSVMRTNLFANTTPEALITIGRVTAALLPALALAGVVSMVIALHDKTPHKSAAGASSRYVGFVAKGVGVGASGFASFYFGVSRGIDPVLAVLCGALLESSFLWSYLSLKAARDRGDRFDVRMWSLCTLLFGLFIAAVSVETLSALGKIDVPIVKALGEVGATLYVSAVGLTVLLTIAVHLLTRAIDDVPGAQAGKPFAIRTAESIRATRAGVGEIKAALAGKPATDAPQLPAGITLADDAPQLEAWRDGDKFAWSVKRGGAVVASGKADTMDAAKAAANQAGGVSTQTVGDGNWLGKFVFVFNGESDYDEGDEIKSRADELMGEIGMRVKHGSPIGLEFWVFDKETFTSTAKMVNGQPMRFTLNSMTVECSVSGFTRAANGSVTHAEVAADVFFKGGMTEAEARKLVAGVVKPDSELMVSGKKVSKNGTIYDETGIEVSPAEADELMRRHREMLDREAQRPK